MRARLWHGIIFAVVAVLAAGAVARADTPSVPAAADKLLWCSVFYLNWSRGVHHQHRPALENRLLATSKALQQQAIAALPPGMDADAVKALVLDYHHAYQQALLSSAPPRFAPEACEALAKGE